MSETSGMYNASVTSQYEASSSTNDMKMLDDDMLLPDVLQINRNIHLAMYIFIGTTGIIDNGFVILVIMLNKSMRKKICHLFIINQSFVDFVCSVFLVTNSPVLANGRPPANRIAGEIYCRIWANSYLLWASFMISTANLVAITIDRFIEIVYPLTYKAFVTRRRLIIIIISIWVVFACVEFGLYGYNSKLNDKGDACILNENGPSKGVRMLNSVLIFVILQVMPVAVMTYCYTRMLKAMRQVQPALSTISAGERIRNLRQQRIRRNLIKTLLIVAIAYILCVTMNEIYFLLLSLHVPLPFYEGTFYHLTVYVNFANCIINPIIYTAKYREFQKSAKALLPCVWKPALSMSSMAKPSPAIIAATEASQLPVINNVSATMNP